jgi:hypothetical protein
MNSAIFVRYSHEISLVKYAKPNQEIDFVRYNREFVITVIVITEFDCIWKLKKRLHLIPFQIVDEFSEQMHDLSRKFFHELLRHHRFTKAFRLAVDLVRDHS